MLILNILNKNWKYVNCIYFIYTIVKNTSDYISKKIIKVVLKPFNSFKKNKQISLWKNLKILTMCCLGNWFGMLRLKMCYY